MTESGGVNTQTGVFYQNSVAALSLADLLELTPLPPRERVVEVRVEAPGHIDDLVIRFADGHREFQNIKTTVTPGSAPWVALWEGVINQINQHDFCQEDDLIIVFEDAGKVALGLREMCERAASSINIEEWLARLTKEHDRLRQSIETVIGSQSDVFELLQRVKVKILSFVQIDDEFARRRLGGGLILPTTLLSILRDIAGGGARRRALFLSAPLRRRLLNDHNLSISTPAEWGLMAYRSAIARLATIEIPGTGVSGPVEELFVWPRTRIYERTRASDFEDECASHIRMEDGLIDIRTFPSEHLAQCVIVAGPGYGKSALLIAITSQLAQSAFVPVVIPLASLAASEANILDFLTSHVNGIFDIRPDWQRLAEQGLLVLLFDGLDEIPAGVRPDLLRRVATFSARYPLSPWILTVRDPAVFTIASGAQLVEILPLEEGDIQRFVETMKKRMSDLDVWRFILRLRMYPDLARLARIPLFLSMLLATVDSADTLPATRSDLIEAYLKTIFSPHEHKVMSGSHDKAIQLRSIAEALAFERLERQEIGASEREVRAVIGRIAATPEDAEVLYQRLRTNGILRQQSAIRLQFPFPIVQEYLAACYLIQHYPDSLSDRFDDAVHRPWAQVIQFALELHTEPTPIVHAMLNRRDDAFCTGLRLVGRCIANGTRVDVRTKEEVGDRLVDFWRTSATDARQRTGRLIADGFSAPIRPSLKIALHLPWLLNDGGGEILSKTSDVTLTLSVMSVLMNNTSNNFFRYHSFSPAINSAGDVAFKAVVERVSQSEQTFAQVEIFDSMLAHFDPGSVSRELAIALALDESKAIEIRLNAFRIAGAPLDARATPLIDQWLRTDVKGRLWPISALIRIHPDRGELLFKILRDNLLPFGLRQDLAGYISQIFHNDSERENFIRKCLGDPDFNPELARVLRVFAARYGDKTIFEALIEEIPIMPIAFVRHTIALFGHYTDRGLGERAVEYVRPRVDNGKDAAELANAAKLGMLYIFEMDFGFGGALRNTFPHPATGEWVQLIEEWCDLTDLTELERISLLTAASELGSMPAAQRLKTWVYALTNPDDPKYDSDEYGQLITSAIREVSRKRSQLPFALAELYVRAAKPNLPLVGIQAIQSHADQPALELLISLHGELTEWHVRDTLANSIESLAAKLGVVVERRDGNFEVV